MVHLIGLEYSPLIVAHRCRIREDTERIRNRQKPARNTGLLARPSA